jgi:hypothetical protein
VLGDTLLVGADLAHGAGDSTGAVSVVAICFLLASSLPFCYCLVVSLVKATRA